MASEQLIEYKTLSANIIEKLYDFPSLINISDSSGLNSANVNFIFNNFSYPSTIDEQFIRLNGENPNSFLWTTDATIQNNKLILSVDSSNYVDTCISKFKLSGDFDIECFWKITTSSDADIWNHLFRVAETTQKWGVYRRYDSGDSGNTIYGKENPSETKIGQFVSTLLDSGFRITRTNSVFEYFYHNGTSWISLGTDTHTSLADVYIESHNGVGSTTPALETEVNSITVNSGTIVWDADAVPDLSTLEMVVPGEYSVYLKSLSPTAYWRLDEKTGTIAVDNIAGTYDGTYKNSPTLGVDGLLTEDNNTAVEFDGVDQWVDSVPIIVGSSWTVGAMVKCTSTTQGIAISTKYPSEVKFVMGFGINVATNFWVGFHHGQWYNIDSGIAPVIGQTYHLVGVKDEGTLKIYVDGVLANSGTGYPDNSGTSSGNVQIGKRWDLVDYFPGTIDEVFVLNSTALTASEVETLYEIGKYTKKIAIEVDHWNQANKTAQIWAKLPVISNTRDTPIVLQEIVSSNFSEYITSLNPIAYYRFAETSGTTLVDEMENKPGAYYGSPTFNQTGLVIDDLDPSVYFDVGTSTYANIVSDFNGTKAITLIMHIISDTSSSAMFGSYFGDNTQRIYCIALASTKKFGIFSNGTIIYSDVLYKFNTSYSLAFNFDGVNTRMYVDGVLQSEIYVGDAFAQFSLSHLTVGAYTYSGTLYPQGQKYLDEFVVFNRSLTEDEISTIYQRAKGISYNKNIGVSGSLPAQQVWSDYSGAYHLSKDGTESTPYNLDGTLINIDETNIVDLGIGKGMSFNGSNEYINVDSDTSNELVIVGDLMISTTFKVSSLAATTMILQHSDYGEAEADNVIYSIYVISTGFIRYLHEYGNGANISIDFTGGSPLVIDTEYVIHFFRNTTAKTLTLYLNGVLFQSLSYATNTTGGTDSTLAIGAAKSSSPPGSHFNGSMKNLSISTTERSSNWITSDIENKADQLFFVTSLGLKKIVGEISEIFAMDEWLCRAWLFSDGTLSDEKIVTGNLFELEIPNARAFPHIVTVSPINGDMWQDILTVELDDKIYPTDTETTPYYYKCIVAGTTGLGEPTWTTGIGDQIVDNTVTWELVEQMVQPITHYPVIPEDL